MTRGSATSPTSDLGALGKMMTGSETQAGPATGQHFIKLVLLWLLLPNRLREAKFVADHHTARTRQSLDTI